MPGIRSALGQPCVRVKAFAERKPAVQTALEHAHGVRGGHWALEALGTVRIGGFSQAGPIVSGRGV